MVLGGDRGKSWRVCCADSTVWGWLTGGVVKQIVHDKGQFVTSCCDVQHCLGDVRNRVVNQNTHEHGQSVTFMTMLSTFTVQS